MAVGFRFGAFWRFPFYWLLPGFTQLYQTGKRERIALDCGKNL
jgi:hypothetical protein